MQLWKKYEIFAKTDRVQGRTTTWRYLRSLAMWLRRTAVVECQTRTFWTDKEMYHQAKQMLQKRPVREGTETTPTILSRWYASESYRETHCQPQGGKNTTFVVRQNRRLEAYLHRYNSWEKSTFESLYSHNKCSADRNTQSYHVVRNQLGSNCIPDRPIDNLLHSWLSWRRAWRSDAKEDRAQYRQELPWLRLNQMVAVCCVLDTCMTRPSLPLVPMPT